MHAAATIPPQTTSLAAGQQMPKLSDRLRESLHSPRCDPRTVGRLSFLRRYIPPGGDEKLFPCFRKF